MRRDLAESKQRLADLEAHGDAALSEYDRSMGYHAPFISKLVRSHIASYEDEIREATRGGEQLSLGL